ncbi:hypothetical protein T07_8404 [Trichinella nelsoni]|uniref:Uncharacterized protein n=1 Tax=Trichinella nelsoni TaxID=6336 RepID=A0A0V0RQZ8_9BILA|nr:hypothetical protein T07_8404 [Trichinella nelsoni]
MDFSCLHNTWSNGILMRLFSGTEVHAPQSVMRHPVDELINLLKIIPKPSEIQNRDSNNDLVDGKPGCRRQRRPSPCLGPLPPFEDVSSGTLTKGSVDDSLIICFPLRDAMDSRQPTILPALAEIRRSKRSVPAENGLTLDIIPNHLQSPTLRVLLTKKTLACLTVNTAGEHCCGAMEGSLSSVPDSLIHYPCHCICEYFAALSFNACNRQKLLCVATGFITTSVSHELLMLECEFPVFGEAPLRWQNIKEA